MDKEQRDDIKTEKKREREGRRLLKWVFIIISALIFLLLGGGYVYGAIYYRTHFFPGSSINGIDCSNGVAEEIAVLVDAQIDTYSLRVTGRDYATGEPAALIGELVPGDISLTLVDSLGETKKLLEEQNEWNWIFVYIGEQKSEYSMVQGIQFDENKLKSVVGGWAACKEENMLYPQDARISDYEDAAGGYRVIPETISTALDMDKVLSLISAAIHEKKTDLDLDQELCYIEPKVRQTDERLNEFVAAANTWLKTKITYDWNGAEVVLDVETLKDWIDMTEDGPTLDETAVGDFVKEQAKKYNTYGKEKKFRTFLNIEMTLASPNYGWRADTDAETQELTALIYQGSVAKREPVYKVTARQKGKNDIGSSYVEIDLTHQHLYLYQSGTVVLEADFVSGKMPENASPAGIFGLSYKTRNATLRGPGYASFVNYWMPFFGNYGMHDAPWRKDFGQTIYLNYGSHGCINLPFDAAAVIYEAVSKGFPVICYYYEVDPLAPSDPGLMPSNEDLQAQVEAGMGQPNPDPAQNPEE